MPDRPIPRPAAHVRNMPDIRPRPRHLVSASGLVALVGFGASLVFAGVLFYRSHYGDTPAAQEFRALAACRSALEEALGGAQAVDVPVVKNYGERGEFYFAWGGSYNFVIKRDGSDFGARVSAYCLGDLATQRVTGLSINGRTMIGP